MTTAIERCSGMINVHAFQSGGETIRIAFAPSLTISDDLEARSFLIPDRQNRGIVLRLF